MVCGLFLASFFGNFAFALQKVPKLISELEKYKSPEIEGITNWLGSKPIKISQQKGKVVLVDFWTYSCINCIRTLPHMNELQKKYGDKGLVIIGVHAPEFEFEKDANNVAAAIERFDLKYVNGMDNNRVTWRNFENRYWPAHYLIDQNGDVVYVHFGEGEYETMDNNIRALLKIMGEGDEKKTSWFGGFGFEKQTPETYLGSRRMARNANENEGELVFPKSLSQNFWALEGGWKIIEQSSETLSAGAKLRLNFLAKKVFLVMDSKNGKKIDVEVKLNGAKIAQNQAGVDVVDGVVAVKESRLYDLVKMKETSENILEIESGDAGLRVYAFTFE